MPPRLHKIGAPHLRTHERRKQQIEEWLAYFFRHRDRVLPRALLGPPRSHAENPNYLRLVRYTESFASRQGRLPTLAELCRDLNLKQGQVSRIIKNLESSVDLKK